MGARDVPRLALPVSRRRRQVPADVPGAHDAPDPPTAELESGPGTDPASRQAPPSRRAALLRSGFIVGVLIVVFGVILPQFIDYQDVIEAFKALTLGSSW